MWDHSHVRKSIGPIEKTVREVSYCEARHLRSGCRYRPSHLDQGGVPANYGDVTGGVISIGPGATLVPNMGALLTALEADTQNKILATPSLMTTENSEASILVGQNVPFITGKTSSSTDGTISPFQTIQRQDLGTILKLKPRIGRNGEVVLSIRQEVSRIDNTTSGLSDVADVKRDFDTVVST